MSDVPLPYGIELWSDLERTIWHQFSRARTRQDWRDMELILLAIIVRMEAGIRTAQAELDDIGMMVETNVGHRSLIHCFRLLIQLNAGSLRSSAACL